MNRYATDWESLVQNYRTFIVVEKNLSPNSVESYMRDLQQLRDFVSGSVGDILPTEVTSEHIEAFMTTVYDKGVQKSSQARVLSGVKSFFNFLLISDIIDSLPTEFIDAPKMGRKLPDVLSVAEIDKIVGSIDLSHPLGHRNKAMLETLYSCGLRVSELITLRLSDLFFDEGIVRVIGKGNKERLVPISGSACRYIATYMEQRLSMKVEAKCEDILFLNQHGRGLTRVMIFTIIKGAALRAGIDKTVSPHTFRHSFATHLLEGGASIRQVQELLGHESILTTEIYTHLDMTHLRRSVEEYHPLGNQTVHK